MLFFKSFMKDNENILNNTSFCNNWIGNFNLLLLGEEI